MAPGKQNVRAVCLKDKLEFKFFRALLLTTNQLNDRLLVYSTTLTASFSSSDQGRESAFFSLASLQK